MPVINRETTVSTPTLANAYIWTALASGVKYFFGFGISMLLARLLTPADYGLIGMVLVFTGFLSAIQESGLAQAIVYFKDDEHTLLSTHHTVNLFAGIVLTATLAAAAPLIAGFYNMPALSLVTQVMGVTFLLNGLRSVSQNLMTKQFRFRELAVIETVSVFSAAAVAIAMAAAGFGVWSLVTNMLLAAAIQTGLILAKQPLTWTFHPDWPCVKRIFRWGLPLTGSNMAWKMYDSSDYLIIGKVLGEQPLGIYTMAFRLATLVNDKIGSVVSRVSFASFASMQDAREQAVQHWHTLTETLTLITFPILVAIAVNAEDLIVLALGAKWSETILPLQILCGVGAVKSLTPMTNNMLSGLGRTDLRFKFTLVNLAVLPLSFWAGAYINGIIGVSWAWIISFPPISAWLTYLAVRQTRSSVRGYLRALQFPVITSFACFITMWIAGALLPQGVLRLSLRSGTGIACYLICLFMHTRSRERMLAALTNIRSRFA